MASTEQSTDQGGGPRPRRFVRTRRGRLIGGVCSGLGSYFDVDPILFRIAFVALSFLGGLGLGVYLIILLFAPEEGASRPPIRSGALWLRRRDGRSGRGSSPDRVLFHTLAVIVVVAVVSSVLAFASAWVAGVAGAAAAWGVVAVGAALVVAAFAGGARWLVVPAIAITLPVAIVAAAGVDLHGGFGDRVHRPASVAELRDAYALGAGRLEVDLRDLVLPQGDTPLRLRIGAGEILLLVPQEVCVATRARIGAGYVGALDREAGGLDVDWSERPDPPRDVPRLVVDGDIGLGALYIANRPFGDWRGWGGWDGSGGWDRNDGQGFQPGIHGTNDACHRPARAEAR